MLPAFFGAPVRHEDDAYKSVMAGFEMMDALVRFNADQALVWSEGDVAWFTTLGEVKLNSGQPQVLLSGVLVRGADRWRVRQMQFQIQKCPHPVKSLFSMRAVAESLDCCRP